MIIMGLPNPQILQLFIQPPSSLSIKSFPSSWKPHKTHTNHTHHQNKMADSPDSPNPPPSPPSSSSSSPPSPSPPSPSNPGPDAPYDLRPKEGEQVLRDGGMLCYQWLFENLRSDRTIHFMMKGLEEAGCPVSFDFFNCIKCDHRTRGYFDSESGIQLCSNYTRSKELLAETMRHELVHAYDVCRANMKPVCSHIACSEIRAANLSGECDFMRDVLRGSRGFSYRKRHKACVREQALRSIQTHPACQGIAEETLDKVWSTCIDDLQPFHSIP